MSPWWLYSIYLSSPLLCKISSFAQNMLFPIINNLFYLSVFNRIFFLYLILCGQSCENWPSDLEEIPAMGITSVCGKPTHLIWRNTMGITVREKLVRTALIRDGTTLRAWEKHLCRHLVHYRTTPACAENLDLRATCLKPVDHTCVQENPLWLDTSTNKSGSPLRVREKNWTETIQLNSGLTSCVCENYTLSQTSSVQGSLSRVRKTARKWAHEVELGSLLRKRGKRPVPLAEFGMSGLPHVREKHLKKILLKSLIPIDSIQNLFTFIDNW